MPLSERIRECMTLIALSTIDPEDQECSICKMPMENERIPHDDTNDASSIHENAEDKSHDHDNTEDEKNLHDNTEEDHTPSRLNICDHTFGLSCIMSWLKDYPTCPLCRLEVYPPEWAFEEGASDLRPVPDPEWTYDIRYPCIETLYRCFRDERVCTDGVVFRSLNLILSNTEEDERPGHAWFWLTTDLAGSIRPLAVGGWPAYIGYLEDVVRKWENDPAQWYPWQRGEPQEDRPTIAEESRWFIETLKAEAEKCREALRLEALGEL